MILLLFRCFMSICGFAYANEASWDSAGVSLRSAVNVTGVEWWILGLALYSQSAIETCFLPPSSPDAGKAGDLLLRLVHSGQLLYPTWTSMLFQIS